MEGGEADQRVQALKQLPSHTFGLNMVGPAMNHAMAHGIGCCHPGPILLENGLDGVTRGREIAVLIKNYLTGRPACPEPPTG